MRNRPTSFALVLLAFTLPRIANASPNHDPYRKDALSIHTGVHTGAGAAPVVAFREIIHVPDAAWLRLRVGEFNLGQHSFITIRSLQDGAEQKLTAEALAHWHNHTALFNGDALELELHVAPRDDHVFVQVDEAWAGQPSDPGPPADGGDEPESLCGGDDRVASSDPRVARLFPLGGCTAWMAVNGAFLTAGHCVDGDADQGGPALPDGNVDPGFLTTVVGFNVPASAANGAPAMPSPSNQYPISGAYIAWQFAGSNGNFNSIGADWAVFSVGPNANGVTPQQAQNAFFRVSNNVPNVGDTMRVTGYGFDWTPNGTGGPGAHCCDFDSDGDCDFICNAQSLTQQTATGPYNEFVDDGAHVSHEYEVDTTPATSGGPVIKESNGRAYGINTNSGCGDGFEEDENYGTAFLQPVLAQFLNDFHGPGTVYADAVDTCADAAFCGDVFDPHDNLPDAVAEVPNGATISIAPGSYTAAAGNTFVAGADGKAMRLIAPFGGAVIGN